MKKFDVEITETLQRTVSVEAVSQEEAEKIVTEAWNNEDYVLDSTDFVGVDFKTVGEQEFSENRKMEILLVQPGMLLLWRPIPTGNTFTITSSTILLHWTAPGNSGIFCCPGLRCSG